MVSIIVQITWKQNLPTFSSFIKTIYYLCNGSGSSLRKVRVMQAGLQMTQRKRII